MVTPTAALGGQGETQRTPVLWGLKMQELIVNSRSSERYVFLIAAFFFLVILAVNGLFLYQALTTPAKHISDTPCEEDYSRQEKPR
jgi:hypothetical protein